MSRPIPDELMDLVVSDVTEGLEPEQRSTLDELVRAHPEVDPPSWERAAALAHLALLDSTPGGRERMPDGLRARLLGTLATVDAGAQETPAGPAPGAPRGEQGPVRLEERRNHTVREGRARTAPARDLGWYLAAGIAIAWVGTQLLSGPFGPSDAPESREPAIVDTSSPEAAAEPDLTPAARRAALLAAGGDVRTASWSPQVDDYAQVSGDVVWSTARQEGYMRLVAMPRNEPARSQYQLWIVDPERDEEPVDGGVFDVAAREVVVPIDAKLAVNAPAAFAITREQPGGVVVSEGPLLVVAAL